MSWFSKFIVHPPHLYRMLYPHALWRVNNKLSGEVYLTFDDGPNPITTPFILDCLKRYDAKATFFVVGENALRYPSLIEDIKREGHSLGNHCMHHMQGVKTSFKEYLDDIETQNNIIDSRLFRPPHGLMRPKQYNVLRKSFRIVMFDILTMDYSPSISAGQIVENVGRYVRDGSIIVFHDSMKSYDRLVEALPFTLTLLKERGYESRALPMD